MNPSEKDSVMCQDAPVLQQTHSLVAYLQILTGRVVTASREPFKWWKKRMNETSLRSDLSFITLTLI